MKKAANFQNIVLIYICWMFIQSPFVVSYVLAQGNSQALLLPPPRTPTTPGGGGDNGGGEASDNDDKDDTIPAPAGARVSGFVYNYSSAAYEGGITVVVDGGGWQVETVADSNGFYQIGDLGVGRAVLNLRLPPGGPQPATIDWPVRLVSEADLQVDLGYYWGDDPPIPVILAGDLKDNRLAVQIENRTPVTATGGLVAILPPAHIKVSPPFEIDKGNVTSFNPRHFQISVADIPAGKNATINTLLQNTEMTAQTGQTTSTVRVVFTYDQQITPQVIEVDLSDALMPVALTTSYSPQAQDTALDQAVSPEEVSPEPAQSQIQATPASQTASQVSVSSTPGLPSPVPPQSQAQVSDSGQATPQPAPTALPQTQSSSESEATPQPPGLTPLPVTGGNQNTTNLFKLSLSALLVLGLGVAGWRSLRVKR